MQFIGFTSLSFPLSRIFPVFLQLQPHFNFVEPSIAGTFHWNEILIMLQYETGFLSPYLLGQSQADMWMGTREI